MPLVYHELRHIARRHLQRERPDHTLQSAALVHEAYLRLLDQRPFDTENRAHFLRSGLAPDAADSGRPRSHPWSRQARCRPHCRIRHFAYSSAGPEHGCCCAGRRSPRLIEPGRTTGPHCRVTLFRRLGDRRNRGSTRISPSTVKRDWNVAKAWLTRQMKRGTRGRHRSSGQGLKRSSVQLSNATHKTAARFSTRLAHMIRVASRGSVLARRAR